MKIEWCKDVTGTFHAWSPTRFASLVCDPPEQPNDVDILHPGVDLKQLTTDKQLIVCKDCLANLADQLHK